MRIVFPAAFLAVGLGSWGCNGIKGKADSAPPPAVPPALGVKAEPVARKEWIVTVPISGNLRSQSIVDVRSEVAGRLVATYFKEGDLVQQNQLLAEIDPVNHRLSYDQAVAAVGVAEAGLARATVTADHARREKERADNLLRTGGITERDHQAAVTSVKDAESQVNLAEAQCRQARAALSVAEKALTDCRILAHAEGYVQKKFFDQGSLLTPGSPLYTLVDNARLELECLMPSYRLSEIRIGQQAVFTTPTWGERRFGGAVTAINPMVESDNRSIKVNLRIANPRGELRSGMFARGDIEIRRQTGALVIPRPALIDEKEESSAGSVYVVKEGRTHRTKVDVGGIQQDRAWIREGLQEGDLVVVEIGPAIKDGIPVSVSDKPPSKE